MDTSSMYAMSKTIFMSMNGKERKIIFYVLEAKRKWLGDNSRENKINPLIPTMNKDHFSWQIYGAGTYTVYLPSTYRDCIVL